MNSTQRKILDGQDSRRQILNCAARIFREKGYAAASLRDIADAVGMRTASLYYHFGSKDEIVAEVLNVAVQTVFAEVRKNLDAKRKASPLGRIRIAVEAHLKAIFETDDYNGASIRIFAQLPPHIAEMTVTEREKYVNFWRELLADAQDAGLLREVDLTLLRLFLFGAMNWAPQWYKPGEYTLSDIADKMCDMFLFGVAKAKKRNKASPSA
jgi:TetR/AcrR family transcriptional regulator, cholesterol catabolism regulator